MSRSVSGLGATWERMEFDNAIIAIPGHRSPERSITTAVRISKKIIMSALRTTANQPTG